MGLALEQKKYRVRTGDDSLPIRLFGESPLNSNDVSELDLYNIVREVIVAIKK